MTSRKRGPGRESNRVLSVCFVVSLQYKYKGMSYVRQGLEVVWLSGEGGSPTSLLRGLRYASLALVSDSMLWLLVCLPLLSTQRMHVHIIVKRRRHVLTTNNAS